MSGRVRVSVHVVAPLLVGGAIYVLLRPVPARFMALAGTICATILPGSPDLSYSLIDLGAPLRALAPDFIAYNLPDGLFAWAFASTMRALHPPSSSRCVERRAWIAAAAAICVGWEVGQAAGLIAGTFDWLDLAVTLLAILAVERDSLLRAAAPASPVTLHR